MEREIKDKSKERGNNSRKSESGGRGVESSRDICKGGYREDVGRNKGMVGEKGTERVKTIIGGDFNARKEEEGGKLAGGRKGRKRGGNE